MRSKKARRIIMTAMCILLALIMLASLITPYLV